MSQPRPRALGFPVGLLTTGVAAAAGLGVGIDLWQGPRDGAPWLPLVYALAAVGAAAAIGGAILFWRRNQSWPGRLFVVAVQGLLVAGLVLLAARDRAVQGAVLVAGSGAALVLGAAVIRYEERHIRVVRAASGGGATTVSELPKCAACSAPLRARSCVMPWILLLAGEALLAAGTYQWWGVHFAQPEVSFERTAHLVAGQLVGAAAVAWWLLYRRFWWQCSGCGIEGPARIAIRRPIPLSPGVSDKSFGEPKPVDIDHACPSCGGPVYSEGGLVRGIAAGFWVVGAALVVAGGLVFAWGIEEGKPAGYIFGILMVAAGGAAVWLGFRYLGEASAARRCGLCGHSFRAQEAAVADEGDLQD